MAENCPRTFFIIFYLQGKLRNLKFGVRKTDVSNIDLVSIDALRASMVMVMMTVMTTGAWRLMVDDLDVRFTW